MQADAYRYSAIRGRKAFLKSYLFQVGFRFTYHLRKVTFYSDRRRGLGLLPYVWHRLLLHRYRFRFGFDISPTTTIGPGLYLGHFGGVVISPHAVLGSNVNIGHGVTIGATSRGPMIGAPTLQDRVWVGASAIIVGKITIGSGALIAPGAYVNFNVGSREVVLGNPGRVVAYTGSDGYVNHVLEDGSSDEA